MKGNDRAFTMIAPIRMRSVEFIDCPFLEREVDLGSGMRLAPVPQFVLQEAAWLDLPGKARQVFDEATAAFVYEFSGDLTDEEASLRGRNAVSVANLACWLALPSGLFHGATLLVESLGSSNQVIDRTVRDDAIMLSARSTRFFRGSAEEAKTFWQGLAPTLDSGGAIQIASRMLWLSLTQEHPDLCYLLRWIALEALFSPSSGAISVQLAQRIALFIEITAPKEDPKRVMETVSEAYSLRSRIAHGATLGRPEPPSGGASAPSSKTSNWELFERTEDLVRGAMRGILADPALLAILGGSEREAFLQRLPFDFVRFPPREFMELTQDAKRSGKGTTKFLRDLIKSERWRKGKLPTELA